MKPSTKACFLSSSHTALQPPHIPASHLHCSAHFQHVPDMLHLKGEELSHSPGLHTRPPSPAASSHALFWLTAHSRAPSTHGPSTSLSARQSGTAARQLRSLGQSKLTRRQRGFAGPHVVVSLADNRVLL